MSNVRTHALARAAYICVNERRDAAFKAKYGALAHRLPSMIMQNGLAQATGFLVAKGKDEHRALLDDLNAVVRATGATDTADGTHLHQFVIAGDINRAMLLTRRCLEASGWLKRYAQSVLQATSAGADAAADGTE